MDRLKEIREREQLATVGKWKPSIQVYNDFFEVSINSKIIAKEIGTAKDASFIANAREDIPYLLDEVAALKAENERLKAERNAAISECRQSK